MTAKKKKEMIQKYHHAHLYYIAMIVSLTVALTAFVQGVITHAVLGNIYLAVLEYFIAVLFFVISRRAYRRGRGHYMY